MQSWDEEIILGRCWELANQGLDQKNCFDIEHFLIDVSFSQLDDDRLRERLQRLSTSFRLSPESVDELQQAAGTILDNSAEFHRFIGSK